MFKGLVVEKHDRGEGQKPKFTAAVAELSDDQLPEGDVTLDVDYSSFNYKDGLVALGLGGLTKEFPHIPGIDMAGTGRLHIRRIFCRRSGDFNGMARGRNPLGRLCPAGAG